MLSASLFGNLDLPNIQRKIKNAAEEGVKKATFEGVEWIKEDVIRGENYVGTPYYPDVKASTKRTKAKQGKPTILIDTTNTVSSFDATANGLEGKITGGGKDYHVRLFERWQIDELFYAVHSKESQDIIKKSIEKAI